MLPATDAPVLHGTAVTLEGVVTAPPYLFAKSYFYINVYNAQALALPQGVQVYMHKSNWPELTIGDGVALSGTYSLSATEPRLVIRSSDSVYPQEARNAVEPLVKTISELADQDIGSLVTIDGLVIEAAGSNVYLEDEGEELRTFIASNTDIDASLFREGSFVSVTGILSKTKAGLRLLPRSNDDINEILVQPLVSETIEQAPEQKRVASIFFYLAATLIAMVVAIIVVSFRIRQRLSLRVAKKI